MALQASVRMPGAGWRERLIGLRNRLIADPRFNRWASSTPLVRLIARKRARALFDLCAGFVYSQVLLACVRLGVCPALARGPRSIDDLASQFDLPHDATARLLRAAASLGILQALPGDRFALADLGASLLGNPSVADFIEHHALLYDDLRDPVALLRGQTQTRMSLYWPYAGDAPDAPPQAEADRDGYARYSALMERSQALVAEDILDAYPLQKHRCLLDVGGGTGAFLAAAASRAPALRLQLFDLPPVADLARARLAGLGLSARSDVHGGSFLHDPLPQGCDIATLVRVLHDHDDSSVLCILRAVHAALPAGGTLLIAEPMAGTPGAGPIGDAYFGFYLLAMGRGRARTAPELQALLVAAGFDRGRPVPTKRPLLTSALVTNKV